MSYHYTVTSDTDADLAGVPAKLILFFEEGSALTVDQDDIVEIPQQELALDDSFHTIIEYNDSRNSCDCYGIVKEGSRFDIVCYEPEDDGIWEGNNPDTNEPFKNWHEVLETLLNHYNHLIEQISVIKEVGDENA
jgi:hypothetical protein